MTYSQGGLIQATDYNNFLNGSNQLNTVWSTGTGDAGYGQTALSTVSVGGLVTAAQWATLINTLNSILTHQAGSGSGISATTAGTLISYLSTLSTNINTAYTNRRNYATSGTTVTGATFSPTATAGQDATYNATVLTRTITFNSGADSARYFFNAGGRFNFVITSVTNNDSTARSADAVSTIATYFGGISNFGSRTNGGRTGTGGTAVTNNTTSGYYNLTTANLLITNITSTSVTYTADGANVNVKSNGVQGANADAGSVLTLYMNYYSLHTTYATGFNDSLNITVNHRVDVVYPELTNITANTWGAVVIS